MIMEVVSLNVGNGTCEDFEAAMRQASPIIAAAPGYISHELRRCLEKPTHYLLMVKWESLEAHMTGFRNSPDFQKWRGLLHHFYNPAPTVQHYSEGLDRRQSAGSAGSGERAAQPPTSCSRRMVPE